MCVAPWVEYVSNTREVPHKSSMVIYTSDSSTWVKGGGQVVQGHLWLRKLEASLGCKIHSQTEQ